MKQNGFPVNEVRAQFPALQRTYHDKPAVYFDGPGGSQAVRDSIEAVAGYMENGGANLHGQFPTSRETEATIAGAREAMADLLAAKPDEVAFGANMTTLTYAISRALGREWEQGGEIVVTEMDHRANVDPWLAAAKERGMTVRRLKVDPDTITLDLDHLDSVINEKTRLVAVGLASNGVGTVNEVARIAARARSVGALTAVDAVHAVPHIAVDRDALGADILLCSAYKFFGPHVGIAVIRSGVFKRLNTYRLAPAPDFIPDKLETGTQNHEGIAGITPAVEFIAGCGEGATRRERIVSGYAKIQAYEDRLATQVREGLAEIPGVILYQAPHPVPKTPTVAFEIEGHEPQEVCRRMAEEHSVFIADGDFYATTLADLLGVNQRGGWIRAGLAPYNTEEEVSRFLNGIKQVVGR